MKPYGFILLVALAPRKLQGTFVFTGTDDRNWERTKTVKYKKMKEGIGLKRAKCWRGKKEVHGVDSTAIIVFMWMFAVSKIFSVSSKK